MSSFATIEQGNEYKMMAAVGLSGPAAVTIDHKRRDFQVDLLKLCSVSYINK